MVYCCPMTNTEPLVTQEEVAEYLSVSTRTLEHWRRVNLGPPYVKLGTRAVRYRMSEVGRWLAPVTTYTHQGESE